MCGRTACTLNPDQISRSSRYRNSRGKKVDPHWKKGDEEKYRPSYNKAPQSFCPVLLHKRHLQERNEESNDEGEERVITSMKWGLVPTWVKDLKQAQFKMNNARSDTMLTKASYKRPLERGQRCVVLADGFYEWNTTKTEKQPYFIYFKDIEAGNVKTEMKQEVNDENGKDNDGSKEDPRKRLITMAGIFERRKSPDDSGDDLFTFSVITVDSHSSFAWLHHRMPAMLENDEEIRKWLDFGDVSLHEAVELIKPKDCLVWHPVSKIVNNSRNDLPECVMEVDLTKPKKQSSESKGMAKWLAKSPTKVKQEPRSPTKVKEESSEKIMKKEIKTESTKPRISPQKFSPIKKGQKRQSSGSSDLMVGWLKKAKKE